MLFASQLFGPYAYQPSRLQVTARLSSVIRDGHGHLPRLRHIPTEAFGWGLLHTKICRGSGRGDGRIELDRRREGGTRFGMGAVPQLPHLTLHPSTMDVPGWLTVATALETFGFLLSISATPIAPED